MSLLRSCLPILLEETRQVFAGRGRLRPVLGIFKAGNGGFVIWPTYWPDWKQRLRDLLLALASKDRLDEFIYTIEAVDHARSGQHVVIVFYSSPDWQTLYRAAIYGGQLGDWHEERVPPEQHSWVGNIWGTIQARKRAN